MKTLDLSLVPEVIYDKNTEFVELYNKAWQLAYAHVQTISGLPVETHMDEGFAKDRLWIWDTCFMVHFCKYAPDIFPGIQSLDNFYLPLYDGIKSTCYIQHPDNPPLFAWVEYEYYKFTGDQSRIYRNLVDKRYLQRHYEYIENSKIGERYPNSFLLNSMQKNECGYFWTGIASGMDNTPRGNDMYSNIYWLDILAQQALSALCISRLANAINQKDIVHEYTDKYMEKRKCLNKYYYDSHDKSYYDIYAATHDVCRVLTPASFWPLLAEVASDEQAYGQVQTLLNPELLGGEIPLPSIARNSPHFCEDGRYWRGGVWLPTSYMATKALEKYAYYDIAANVAECTINRMNKVYHNYFPATIWEAYSPTSEKPAAAKKQGSVSRPDFCGWSALGPISMMIENVLGIIDVNAIDKSVKIHRRRIGLHGVKNLRFGSVCCDIILNDQSIHIKTNSDFTLVINDEKLSCHVGDNCLNR